MTPTRTDTDGEFKKDDGDDEFKVQRILGHSFVFDGADDALGAANATQFLVLWSGTDATTGQPWPATWHDFCDVGSPLIVGYFHRLATKPGPKPVPTAPDHRGRVYTYVDATVEHQPICQPTKGKRKTVARGGNKNKGAKGKKKADEPQKEEVEAKK